MLFLVDKEATLPLQYKLKPKNPKALLDTLPDFCVFRTVVMIFLLPGSCITQKNTVLLSVLLFAVHTVYPLNISACNWLAFS